MLPQDIINSINHYIFIAPKRYMLIHEGNHIRVKAGLMYKAKVVRIPYYENSDSLVCDVQWDDRRIETVEVDACSEILYEGRLRNKKKVSNLVVMKKPFIWI